MKISYTENAKSDIAYWKETNNQKIQARIKSLVKSIEDTPFYGIGKPEPLKHDLAGCWSRRINREHRITYKVENERIIILSARHHYPV